MDAVTGIAYYIWTELLAPMIVEATLVGVALVVILLGICWWREYQRENR